MTFTFYLRVFSTIIILIDISNCNYSSETTESRLSVDHTHGADGFTDSGIIYLFKDIESIVRELGGSTKGPPSLQRVFDYSRVSFNRTYFYGTEKFKKTDPNASICVYSIETNNAHFNLVTNDDKPIRKILYECALGQSCCYGLICCDELVLAWWQIILIVTGVIFGSIICCWVVLCILAHCCSPNREKTMETPDFHMSEMSTVSLSKYESNYKALKKGTGRQEDDSLFSLIANMKKADRELMLGYKKEASAVVPSGPETKKSAPLKCDRTPPTTTTSPSSPDDNIAKRMRSQGKLTPKFSKEASMQASLWKKSLTKT